MIFWLNKHRQMRNANGFLIFFIFAQFFRLLECERDSMELYKENHKWNDYDPRELEKPHDIYADRAIFPMHSKLKLYPCDIEEMQYLRKHCDELHKMAKL